MKDTKALLKKVARGDESAFRMLFELNHPNIYTTALRILADQQAAEDIVQDTFMRVWINRATLDQIDDFQAWLYTLAKNIAFNVIKKRENYKQYMQQKGQQLLSELSTEADYALQDKDFQYLLEKAVQRLPPKQQQTYKLLKESNLKRKEVAEILNVSPETVKYNIDQAMRSIRSYCSAHMKDMPLVFLLHFFTKYF